MRLWILLLMVVAGAAQDSARPPVLKRQYIEGRQWSYRMHGDNNGATYDHRITVAVRKRADGRLVDEVTWSAAPDLRQAITLDAPDGPFSPADVAAGIAKAPALVGPFTDLLTFYADLYLAMRADTLNKPGDSSLVHRPSVTGSWADGNTVVLGEDHVDFEIQLMEIARRTGTVTLLVKHVPPASPKIRLPAEWMKAPVSDTPNNFVEIRKLPSGYLASVGKETFDVTLTVRLADGVLTSAVMDNPVLTTDRDCVDAAAANCGEGRPGRILRHIELTMIGG